MAGRVNDTSGVLACQAEAKFNEIPTRQFVHRRRDRLIAGQNKRFWRGGGSPAGAQPGFKPAQGGQRQ
jgi:hypothetical protein